MKLNEDKRNLFMEFLVELFENKIKSDKLLLAFSSEMTDEQVKLLQDQLDRRFI